MLAKLTRDMPSAPDLLYEPKWDGFRCVLFRDGDDLDLQSRNQKPLMRYFPELREPLLEQLPQQVALDGELVIATPNGLDFDALQLRQHPAASRVKKLAEEIPASFVAFDLLALGEESVLDEPLGDPYAPGARTMLKVKHDRTCECVAAGFRVHKDGKGVGSLLLGLYDDEGVLHHVGVGSGMAAPVRERLRSDIEPLRKNALEGHPWRD